jgi:2-methylcitrate dehydratase PrpD
MPDSVTGELAAFVARVRPEDVPKGIVEKVKLLLLDDIGDALGGYITDRARIALEFVQENGGGPHASVIGGHLTSYPLASFLNGELINALDYDAIGPLGSHVTPYVTPTSLTIAERHGSSGVELITALALAHEIGGRVLSSMAQQKMVVDEPPGYKESPRFSTSGTIFGAVAGGAYLLGFNRETVANALGIAGASTPVPGNIKWHHTVGPSIMLKYNCWSGWVAQLASVAVLLAEKGFTGDRTILDGEYGYWQMVGSPYFLVDNLLGGLGQTWHLDQVAFKMYPTCAPYHAAIEGISRLVTENQLSADDIDSIVVKCDPILLTPNRAHTEIHSFADMQFAVRPNMAMAVLYGDKPGPSWQTPHMYQDPRIQQLVPKISLEIHPDINAILANRSREGRLPMYMGSEVQINAGGKLFLANVDAPRGSQERPVGADDLIQKFRTNASYSQLSAVKSERIIDLVLNLETLADVRELCEVFRLN